MLTKGQILIFAFTYITYGSIYMTRKPFSVVKSNFKEDTGYGTSELGMIDTAFLVAYAIGQFSCGALGDRYGPKIVLILGFFGSALSTYLFAQSSNYNSLISLWFVNGFAQAGAFPMMMKVLQPWFSSTQRGSILGFWTTCQQIGGIASTAWAASLSSQGWRVACATPALFVGISAIILIFLPQSQTSKSRMDYNSPISASLASSEKILSFREVLALPGILPLGVAYFCIKLVRYTLLFWLPYYLAVELKMSLKSAGILSTIFDIGGAIGSVGCGVIADKYLKGKRILILLPCCILTGLALLPFDILSRSSPVLNALVMLIAGLAVAAPDSMLGGACTGDACDAANAKQALGTAAGITNGIGSIGAILQGFLASSLVDRFGWAGLFAALGTLSLAAAGVLSKLSIRDYKSFKDHSNKVI